MDSFLAIGFGLLAAYLAWRLFMIRRAIGELTKVISNDGNLAKRSELPPSVAEHDDLADLSRSAIDQLSEAFLQRDSEIHQRRFLEALLNEIENAIIVVDDLLEIRFSNRAAELLFPGEQPHAGRSLIQACRDHRVVDAVELAMEIGGKTQEKFKRRTEAPGDGRVERSYLIEAEPLSALERGQGAWVLIQDITLQLETEQIRQDFVANASHELRTPLSIINGYLEMLDQKSGLEDEKAAGRAIHTMRKHSDRLSRIVEDMLTISKLENPGTDALKMKRFDISECIESTMEHLQPLIEDNEARIDVALPDAKDDRDFYGDRFYWDQIFFNLIENALKQNPASRLKIKVRVISDGGRQQVEISDNGVGIPATDLPHIFKRFFRVQKDHSQEVKGTGLGLSIVKRAVDAHHGSIAVTSRPGQKTTFTISVPGPPANVKAVSS